MRELRVGRVRARTLARGLMLVGVLGACADLEPRRDPKEAPHAVFSMSPDSGVAPLTVSFDGSGSRDPDGGPLAFSWDFGDGSAATLPTPRTAHTYADAGRYVVTLVVTDDENSSGEADKILRALPARPAPLVDAAVISRIRRFGIAPADEGGVALAYCQDDCESIQYRLMTESGDWSAAEVIVGGWDREHTYGYSADFCLAAGASRAPHVFWGEAGDLHHATRAAHGRWTITNETASISGVLGGNNAASSDWAGSIAVGFSSDYWVGGGYRFSDLGLLAWQPGEAARYSVVPLGDEEVFEVDLAVSRDFGPLFVVTQGAYGGWGVFKLVYQDGSSWSERTLKSAWGLDTSPVHVVAGSTIHVVGSHTYYNLEDVVAQPRADNRGGPCDVAVDETDRPYLIVVDSWPADSEDAARLDVRVEDDWVSLPLNSEMDEVHGEPPRIVLANGRILVAYLTANRTLNLKVFDEDSVRSWAETTSDVLSEMPE